MDYDIAFLGGVFPNESYDLINKNSITNMQNAANSLQWKMIKGLDENNNTSTKIITYPFVGSYPKRYKKMFVEGVVFSHDNISEDISIGYCNLSVYKQLRAFFIIKKHLKKWLLSNDGRKKILFIYSPQNYFLKIVEYINRRYYNVLTCLIIPDLPEYTLMDRKGFLVETVKKINMNALLHCASKTNWIICLTKQMAERLNIQHYSIVEGIAYTKMNYYPITKKSYIAYTGSLTRKYGIMNLIKSFEECKLECELWICGDGECKEEILSICHNNKKIKYLGRVSNHAAYKIQQDATILINPRPNDSEYTAYSFPSKTMEYMIAGRPVICYKLDGIPEEYDEYLIYVDKKYNGDLKKALEDTYSMPVEQLNSLGEKNIEFVSKYKSPKAQMNRVLTEMIRYYEC